MPSAALSFAGSRAPAPTLATQLVRDLQGLVRLLYRAERHVDMPDSHVLIERLGEAGRALGEALQLARKAGPRGQVPVSAWGWTDKGVRILREVVEGQSELRELVRVVTLLSLRPILPRRSKSRGERPRK